MRTRFPKTLKAVRLSGGTQGDIGNALVADIHATDGAVDNHANRAVNSFQECQEFLHQMGYEYGHEYLRALYRAASITPRLRDHVIE